MKKTKIKIFTIGFTNTSAGNVFERLLHARRDGLCKLADVRLNNTSQLSGFAKRDDLRYFARKICKIGYEHRPELLAPTQEIFGAYKKKKIDWATYEKKFLKLMAQRKIEKIARAELDGACLLCSEDKPHHCHRRLVAEYLSEKWGGLDIVHL